MGKKSIDQLRKEVKEFEERKKLEAKLKKLQEGTKPKVSKTQSFVNMLGRAANRLDVSSPN